MNWGRRSIFKISSDIILYWRCVIPVVPLILPPFTPRLTKHFHTQRRNNQLSLGYKKGLPNSMAPNNQKLIVMLTLGTLPYAVTSVKTIPYKFPVELEMALSPRDSIRRVTRVGTSLLLKSWSGRYEKRLVQSLAGHLDCVLNFFWWPGGDFSIYKIIIWGANRPYSPLRAELRRTRLQRVREVGMQGRIQLPATSTHYDHGAQPRSKVFDFFLIFFLIWQVIIEYN